MCVCVRVKMPLMWFNALFVDDLARLVSVFDASFGGCAVCLALLMLRLPFPDVCVCVCVCVFVECAFCGAQGRGHLLGPRNGVGPF